MSLLGTIDPLYLWVPNLWIQPIADRNNPEKKNSMKFQRANLEFAVCQIICQIHMDEIM